MFPGHPVLPGHAPSATPVGLAQAFLDALPARDWMGVARSHALVALFELDDWKAWLPQAGQLLDDAEQARVARRRRRGDRENLTLAYALHRLFLGAALGLDPANVPLGRDERGCPRLGSLSASTSLSHTDEYLAMAVCRRGCVGVDIEPAARTAGMPEIAAQVCHPAEAERLAGAGERAEGEALLALWVRKEALLKAAGVGLAREMNSFQAPEGVALPLDDAPEGGQVRLHMLNAGPAAMAAVAAPPETPVRAAWLRQGPGWGRARA